VRRLLICFRRGGAAERADGGWQLHTGIEGLIGR
jgi:hypothetical protein